MDRERVTVGRGEWEDQKVKDRMKCWRKWEINREKKS